MTNVYQLPPDLPVPLDDGTTRHLPGMALPSIDLASTLGGTINPATLNSKLIIYCYPMTGQPGVALPEGWDQIPGARGCTPQSCAYRDLHTELLELGCTVFGLSSQTTDYQREMAERNHLPFAILSDPELRFLKALKLPSFEVAGMTLYKRVTLIVDHGIIEAVHYPIFPSDSDAAWVLNYLKHGKQD